MIKNDKYLMRVQIFKNNNRTDIYKLWYKIYYEEMNRNHNYACHKEKIITDELESNSIILVLKKDDKIIGTSRLNTSNYNLGEYYNFYELDTFKNDNIAIITKFMVEKIYRKNQTSYILALSTVEYCKRNNIEWIVIDCSPRLYKFFNKLGFKEHLGIKNSEEYGEVKIMKFNVHTYDNGLLTNKKLINRYKKYISL